MTEVTLHDVPVASLPTERFATVLDPGAYRDLLATRERAGTVLAGRTVWCVSSTETGGGVAEMLRSLLAYTSGAGVDSRWVVVHAPPDFFVATKQLHNWLHGTEPSGGVPLSPLRTIYERVTEAAGTAMARMVRAGDVVILHDPQTLGMAAALREAGVSVVWRCHVGVDEPDATTRTAWEILRPHLASVDAFVFSRERFVWEGLDDRRVMIVPPSIDVFSPKNQELDDDAVAAILRAAGVVAGGGPPGAFLREDGSPGQVTRTARMVQDAPLALGDRIVAQVSRWDRLKDPVGVLEGFAAHVGETGDAHLLLVGPDVDGVQDDPEGAAVLAEVTAAWGALPTAARRRIHLATLPMADADENGAIVNAIQRHAAVMVQKSLAEGFGLTVTEAAWKARPIVASGVGGIQDQVVDRVTGLLVDPLDLAAFGHAVIRLLTDAPLARRLGTAARERVRQHFLEPRHLRQWLELIERLPSAPPTWLPPAPPAGPPRRRPAPGDRPPVAG